MPVSNARRNGSSSDAGSADHYDLELEREIAKAGATHRPLALVLIAVHELRGPAMSRKPPRRSQRSSGRVTRTGDIVVRREPRGDRSAAAGDDGRRRATLPQPPACGAGGILRSERRRFRSASSSGRRTRPARPSTRARARRLIATEWSHSSALGMRSTCQKRVSSRGTRYRFSDWTGSVQFSEYSALGVPRSRGFASPERVTTRSAVHGELRLVVWRQPW